MMGRRIMPADRVMRYFVYRHTDGSRHLKRYNDPGDIKEMCDSDFVQSVFQVTEEQWRELARPMTPEERAAVILSDNKIGDPRMVEGGIVRQIK